MSHTNARTRVLLVTQYYYPYTKSAAKLMHDLAVEMVRQRADVTVVTPDENLDVSQKMTTEEGVNVFRVRCGSLSASSSAMRAWNERAMVRRTWREGKRYFRENRCDLLVWWAPSIFYISLVKNLKRIWHCRSYLLLRDVIPKWWVDCGVVKEGSIIHRLFKRLERKQYGLADVVAVQSPGNLRYFQEETHIGNPRVEILWNWTRTSGERVSRTDSRTRLGLDGKVVFFYGGNIGVAQDMGNIVRLAESLRNEKRIHFLLVGDGSEAPKIRESISGKGLPNVTLLPPVDQETYLGMVSEYDVGLISLDRNHSTQNFPGKMLGYMYFSLPILASINPGNDLKDLMESRSAGFVTWNGDDDGLKANALKLAESPDLRRRMGAKGRGLLESVFSVETAARQILGHAESGSHGLERA